MLPSAGTNPYQDHQERLGTCSVVGSVIAHIPEEPNLSPRPIRAAVRRTSMDR